MTTFQPSNALFDNKKIIKNKGITHIHNNGLHQLNLSDQDGYCALFVVHTPTFDDSGVAHAVEHFVFRRSKAFNNPSSLFQLTSLTDLLINASTMADVTYFHCQSRCKSTFDLGLRYLLNGLLFPEFLEEDLSQEVYDGKYCGVLYRELSGIYQENSSKVQYQVGISDISDNRTYQHGGYCSTIGELTTDDLINYHRQYYRPEKITLVTTNTDVEMVARLLNDLPVSTNNSVFSSKNNRYRPKPSQPIKKYHASKLLIRFWVSIDCYHYFEHHFNVLEALLLARKAVLVPLQPNVNNASLFAVNVIVNQVDIDDTVMTLNQFITKNPYQEIGLDNEKTKHQNPKYSPAINRLLDCYYNDIEADQPKSSGQLIISEPTIHRLAQLDIAQNSLFTDTDAALLPVNNILIPSLKKLAVSINPSSINILDKNSSKETKQRKPSLPKLLFSLYQQATQSNAEYCCREDDLAVATDRNNCIVVARMTPKNAVIAGLVSFILAAYPRFIAARMQGHCYLIGARYLEQSQELAIFSVLDVSVIKRLRAMSQNLLLLSQDIQFITESLTLAKVKFANEYQVDLLAVEDVSITALAALLTELSVSLGSVIKNMNS